MKYDFNQPLLGLTGKPIYKDKAEKEPVLLKDGLSQQMAQDTTSPDAPKFFNWAVKLVDGEAIDLDSSDQKKLKEWIERNKTFSMFTQKEIPMFTAMEGARLIEYMEGVEDKAKENKSNVLKKSK